MDSPQANPNKILAAAFVTAVLVIVWLSLKIMNDQPEKPIERPDNTKWEHSNDSLKNRVSELEVVIEKKNKVLESLNKSLAQNHESVKKHKDEIKNFTADSRLRFHDSVMRANGFR